MVCEFHGSNGNGFGDIWWTDNPIYFISIDGVKTHLHTAPVYKWNMHGEITQPCLTPRSIRMSLEKPFFESNTCILCPVKTDNQWQVFALDAIPL